MICENFLYQPSLTSNNKNNSKHVQQIILKKLTRWKYMFRLKCGIALLVIYFVIQSQKLLDYSNSSTVSERKLNVSAIFTGLKVSYVTVGLYYLPPNESQTSRHRALKESAHGTKDIFGYPIGAQLLSNVSEYEIPSDKLFYQRQAHQFKYFHEMTGQSHMDARFGKPEYTRLSDVERGNILRGLFATWYVYSFRT